MSASLPMGRAVPASYDPAASMIECFVAGWLTLMPVNSFVVIPAIQGTTPAYLLAFVSLFLVFLPGYSAATAEVRRRYIKAIVCLALLWVLNVCVSQVVNLSSPPDYLWNATLINPGDTRAAFRSTIVTQSIYLAACVSVFLFFRYQFQERWWKYVFWGAWLLVGYGVYEWVYFLIFQTPGDFIANRSYADTPGSWSQTLDFGPVNLLRIKSTQGEPSFLSVVVLPYLYLAMEQRRRCLAAALLFVAIFSTSTSAFFGLAFGAIVTALFRRKLSRRDLLLIASIATAWAVCYFVFPDIYANLFTDKLAGTSDSGEKRQFSPLGVIENFFELPPLQWFSGVGFGYTYSNAGISVLFNCGLSGFSLFAFAFLFPVFRLPSTARGIALKTGLAVMFFLFLISVAELFLPTTWMFLGLAYWQMASPAESSNPIFDGEIGNTVKKPVV
jgi:hypothetical protein